MAISTFNCSRKQAVAAKTAAKYKYNNPKRVKHNDKSLK
jgi:hypothetical protein